MSKNRKIHVNETEISVIIKDETDYISLTDMGCETEPHQYASRQGR